MSNAFPPEVRSRVGERKPSRSGRGRGRYDAVIIGGGHNGLVAATLLGRAGLSVLVLERRKQVGGAAVSGSPFDGVGVRLSRYAYLVSLFPHELLRTLGVTVGLGRRQVSSYTPDGDTGLLVEDDRAPSGEWARFYRMVGRVAGRVFPTLMRPLLGREQLRRLVADDRAWEALFEQPLSAVLERQFSSDLVRGVVLTDGTIGTFAPADDPLLRQNRCFLYHVIGNGTGRWDVPIGGMGALTEALARSALATAGVEIRTHAEVVSLATDGHEAEVACEGQSPVVGRHVLANVAPDVLRRLLGAGRAAAPAPEGAQLKINMLLSRLPRLRDPSVRPEQAFAGTFHVNEGYAQLQRAYQDAANGTIPTVPPCELYCHSLTDPSILSPDPRAAGAHTLTLFGLHMPARLFSDPSTHDERKDAAVAATLRSLNSVLAEPIEECLWRGPDGRLCIETLTPAEIESELGMPGGHIFHRDLAWPFAESEQEVGTWGVETQHRNVWLCGAGARRGGGVSGIPGHNAAQAVLAAWSSR
jgi:phytoene dehydrogenase-like protein